MKLVTGAGPSPLPDSVGLPDDGTGDGVLVEPFFNQRKQLKLLATFPFGADARVNGEPAPRRAVLEVGDVVQWAAGVAFHVTVFNRPRVGPPPADLVGKACPICQVPFPPDTTTYTCACGCVFHCEADEKDGLQCAQLRGECPRCRRPVVLEPGYAFIPGNE